MRQEKVILIHPKNETDDPVYPLGCLYLSAFLLRDAFKVVIFDHNDNNDYEEFLKANLGGAVCVGISAMVGAQLKHGLKIAECVRRIDRGIPLVWGGTLPTAITNLTIKDPRVDIVVREEGELTFLGLVKALAVGSSLEGIKGITYKTDQRIFHNPRQQVLDLSTLPPIPWQRIDIGKKLLKAGRRSISIQTGRGCLYSCTFCAHEKVTPETYRGLSPKYVFDSIEPVIRKHSISCIDFYEPYFISSEKRIKEFCLEMLNRNLEIKWGASARADTFSGLSQEALGLLRESGCEYISFGFESGSSRIIDRIDKRIRPWQMIKSVQICKEYSISPDCYFITGFPFEGAMDTLKTLAVISKINNIFAKMTLHLQGYVPLPNTILYNQCLKKYGLSEPTSLDWYGDYNHLKANTPWLGFIQKVFVRLLGGSVYLSDIEYLRRKRMPLKLVLHWLVKLSYKFLYIAYLIFKKEFSPAKESKYILGSSNRC